MPTTAPIPVAPKVSMPAKSAKPAKISTAEFIALITQSLQEHDNHCPGVNTPIWLCRLEQVDMLAFYAKDAPDGELSRFVAPIGLDIYLRPNCCKLMHDTLACAVNACILS